MTYAERALEQWAGFSPALKAISEGKVSELTQLWDVSLEIARVLYEELHVLHDHEPIAENVISVVMLAAAFDELIEPTPPTEYCQMLAVAALAAIRLEALVPPEALKTDDLPEL